MIGLAIDENFNNDVLRGLLRRNPGLNIVRIQDVGLRTLDDDTILAWCAENDRVLITHDVSTMSGHAFARLASGQNMSGVFEVPRSVPASVAIEDLRLIAECSFPGEWEGQVRYLPLR